MALLNRPVTPRDLNDLDDDTFLRAVARAELHLLGKELPDLDTYRSYYQGDQLLAFGSEKFREQFGTSFEGFKDNWCEVVADAPLDKMEVIGLTFPSKDTKSANPAESPTSPITDQIWDAFQANEFKELQQDVHEGMLVESRSAVIVWPDPELGGARMDFQPAQTVRVRYSDDDRRTPVLAVKRWETPSGEIRVNVYTNKAVFKYTEITQGQGDSRDPSLTPLQSQIPSTSSGSGLRKRQAIDPRSGEVEPWPLPHNFGEVPVVEFFSRKGSKIKNVIPQQDAMNFLLMAGFGMAEEATLPPRGFFTGVAAPQGGWKMGPGQLWAIPPQFDADGKPISSSEFQFEPGDLDQLRNFTDSLLMHMAFTSKTPLRYFFQSDRGGRGDAPSGESLLVSDQQLLDYVDTIESHAGNRWWKVARLVGKAITNSSSLDLPPGIVVWRDPRAEYRSIILEDAVKMKEVGLPYDYIISTLGLSPDEIEMVKKMREEEMKREKEEMREEAQFQASLNPPTPSPPQ